MEVFPRLNVTFIAFRTLIFAYAEAQHSTHSTNSRRSIGSKQTNANFYKYGTSSQLFATNKHHRLLSRWRVLRRPRQHRRAASTATSSKQSSQTLSSAVQNSKQLVTVLANARRPTGRATNPPAIFQALVPLPSQPCAGARGPPQSRL